MTQYLYHPDQPNTTGEDFRWDDSDFGDWEFFQSGRWYHLRHRVVMNTVVNGVGQHDVKAHRSIAFPAEQTREHSGRYKPVADDKFV